MFVGYKTELLNNQNSKISEITTFNNKIIQYKDERLNRTEKELLDTKTVYQQTLKNVELLHVKYGDKLNLKDEQIANIHSQYLNQNKIKSDLKNDTER